MSLWASSGSMTWQSICLPKMMYLFIVFAAISAVPQERSRLRCHPPCALAQSRSLRENDLRGTLPNSWSRLTGMESIYIQDNNLEGTLPRQWSTWRQIHTLRMLSNEFTGTLPREWSTMRNIRRLHLDENNLRGTIPRSWSTLRDLREL